MKRVLFISFTVLFCTQVYSQGSTEVSDEARYVDSMADYMDSIGDYPSAISYYTKDIQLHSSNSLYDIIQRVMIYTRRAEDKLILKDYRGAISDNTRLINISSENGEAYFKRGLCKIYLGDKEGAIKDFTARIKLGDKIDFGKYYSEAYYYRGLVKIYLNLKGSGCLDLSKAGELGDTEAYDLIKQYCN